MEKKVKGNVTVYILKGPLGERSQLFEQPIPKTLNQEICINMEQVTSINSVGVKGWILWTSQIPRIVKFSLEKCPYVVINQVNMIHGFIPEHTIIESFFAPFICESCEHESVQLVTLGKDYVYASRDTPMSIKSPLEFPCDKCGQSMAPDFFFDKIFAFLNKRKAVKI